MLLARLSCYMSDIKCKPEVHIHCETLLHLVEAGRQVTELTKIHQHQGDPQGEDWRNGFSCRNGTETPAVQGLIHIGHR